MYDNKKQKLNQHHKFEFLKLTKKKKEVVRIVATEVLLSSVLSLRATTNTSSYCLQGRETECVEATKHTHNRGPCVNMISTDTLKQKKQQHTDHLISATLFQDEIMDGAHFKLKKT